MKRNLLPLNVILAPAVPIVAQGTPRLIASKPVRK